MCPRCPARPSGAAEHAPIGQDRPADAGAEREQHDIAQPARRAAPRFAEQRGVRVVRAPARAASARGNRSSRALPARAAALASQRDRRADRARASPGAAMPTAAGPSASTLLSASARTANGPRVADRRRLRTWRAAPRRSTAPLSDRRPRPLICVPPKIDPAEFDADRVIPCGICPSLTLQPPSTRQHLPGGKTRPVRHEIDRRRVEIRRLPDASAVERLLRLDEALDLLVAPPHAAPSASRPAPARAR